MPIGAIGGAVAGGAALLDNKNARQSRETSERQRDESQAFIEQQIAKSRGDLFKFFPQGQESRRLGAQAGLDLISQSMPQQIESFQGGNVAAQNMLIQGLPHQQNAILGRPSNFNPQAVQLGGGLNVPQLPEQIQIGAE